MKRGEIWWVNFDPSVGEEINKIRPAIIISNDAANEVLNRIQVIPLTSNVSKCYPWEVYVIVNGKQSKAMTDQIMTASKLRLKSKISTITSQEMLSLEYALKLQLGIYL